MESVKRQIPIFFLLIAALAHPQSPPRDFPIDSITVEGNRILTADGIIAASGLKLGEKGDTAIFDAARDRLLASGYLETVTYTFKASEKGQGYDVGFEVLEMQPLYPLRIEALGATAPEVEAWLKTKDPLFSGRVPGTQPALDRTAREIEQLLESKNKPEKVGGKIVALSPQRFEAMFTPAAGLPNVAQVTFEGNKAIRDTTLQNAIADVAFGQPYTETSFRLLLENQIGGVYEKEGYMRVTFPKITTTPSSQVRGVDVKVVIEEGTRYKLGTVGVRGAREDQEKHILRVAKIQPMAVVDFDQVKAAAQRVRQDLIHEGYLDAQVSTDRDINEEQKTVNVFLVPQPGPQYMFGKLEIKGLGLDGEDAIRKMWTLRSGEPYAGEYPDYFLKRVKDMGIFDNLADARAEPDISAETHIANVTLIFRYGSDNAPKKNPGPGDAPDTGFPPFPR